MKKQTLLQQQRQEKGWVSQD